MDYIQVMQDSVDTSVSMGFFKNRKDSSYAHIFKSNLENFSMKLCEDKLNNFDKIRLQKSASKAYPLSDRPRGQKDLDSVNYYKKIKNIPPIWIIKKNKGYTLLDGAHRLVANYIQNKKFIKAYIIYL